MEIAFNEPKLLWLFLVVPFLITLHLITLKRKRNLALRFSNFEAIERVSKGLLLTKPYRGLLLNKNIFLLALRTTAYSLLILSMSNPVIWYHGKAPNYDYVIAIDSSSSMLADDFKPNRLESAKESAISFVDSVSEKSKIGIISFAGDIFIDINPTTKKEDIKNAIKSIKVKKIGGTNIGDALITAVNIFDEENKKIIILLTDGQSNIGTPVEDALDYVKSKESIVYTIGVGTREGGGTNTIGFSSQLDEESLKMIANQTGGKYFNADNKEMLKKTFKEIAMMKEKKLSKDLSWIMFILALLILSIEWFLVSVKYKTIP